MNIYLIFDFPSVFALNTPYAIYVCYDILLGLIWSRYCITSI